MDAFGSFPVSIFFFGDASRESVCYSRPLPEEAAAVELMIGVVVEEERWMNLVTVSQLR